MQLNLKNKGEYKVTLQYEVLTGKFFAKMTGNEIIEPEPEGYPEKLYMIGDEFGNWNWNSTNVVEMALWDSLQWCILDYQVFQCWSGN